MARAKNYVMILNHMVFDLSLLVCSCLPVRKKKTGPAAYTLGAGLREALKAAFSLSGNSCAHDHAANANREKSELEVWHKVNARRVGYGIGELAWRDDLGEIARCHSEDMIVRKYFAHVSPDGKDIGNRFDSHHLRYSRCGENIAMNNFVADAVDVAIAGWMLSRGHRMNILNPAFTATGVGSAISRQGEWYFTQVFYTP